MYPAKFLLLWKKTRMGMREQPAGTATDMEIKLRGELE